MVKENMIPVAKGNCGHNLPQNKQNTAKTCTY